jgi:hypothetical protein
MVTDVEKEIILQSIETTMGLKVKLNLEGLDGNAFALMGAFRGAAKRQGFSEEEISEVINECMSGNYENLLCTLMDNTIEEDEK